MRSALPSRPFSSFFQLALRIPRPPLPSVSAAVDRTPRSTSLLGYMYTPHSHTSHTRSYSSSPSSSSCVSLKSNGAYASLSASTICCSSGLLCVARGVGVLIRVRVTIHLRPHAITRPVSLPNKKAHTNDKGKKTKATHQLAVLPVDLLRHAQQLRQHVPVLIRSWGSVFVLAYSHQMSMALG